MQSPKYGQNNVRVTPSNYGKRQKKSQQMENHAIGHVIRELLIDGVVPTVLVLLDDPSHVTIAGITIHGGHFVAWVVNTSCIAAKPSKSCHMTSLSKSEDRAGQGKHYHPNYDTSGLDSFLGL